MENAMAFFNALKCTSCNWCGFQADAVFTQLKGKTHIVFCPNCSGRDFVIASHAATNGVNYFNDDLTRCKVINKTSQEA